MSRPRNQKQSPITQFKAELDGLVGKIEQFHSDCEDYFKGKQKNSETEKDFRRRFVHYDQMVNEKLQQVYRLTQDGEPVPLADFNDRKKQEIRRLNRMQEMLSKISVKLHHDPVEQSYFRSQQKSQGVHDSSRLPRKVTENEGEDDEDDEADEDDEDSVTEGSYFEEEDNDDEGAASFREAEVESRMEESELPQAECLADFVGEQDDDLSFVKGDIIYIIDMRREDGWWVAENSEGQQGLVPSNYLKLMEASQRQSQSPSPPEKMRRSLSPRGRELWDKVKSAIKQPTVADVLLEMGAIPSGFRTSTLGKLLNETSSSLTSSWLVPKLSDSHLAFRDLHWDYGSNKLRSHPVAVTRGFSILGAYNIPAVTPASGLTILSRHIRVAVFNKQDVLSNVHTVRAVWITKEPKTWKFSPKA
jgi:nephrocystin-1